MEIAVLKRKEKKHSEVAPNGGLFPAQITYCINDLLYLLLGHNMWQEQLKERGVCSSPQFEGTVHQNQGRHGWRNVRLLVPQLGTRERDERWCFASLLTSAAEEPRQREGTAYILKWSSCLLFISPQIQPQALSELCLLGDSKSSQADDQD